MVALRQSHCGMQLPSGRHSCTELVVVVVVVVAIVAFDSLPNYSIVCSHLELLLVLLQRATAAATWVFRAVSCSHLAAILGQSSSHLSYHYCQGVNCHVVLVGLLLLLIRPAAVAAAEYDYYYDYCYDYDYDYEYDYDYDYPTLCAIVIAVTVAILAHARRTAPAVSWRHSNATIAAVALRHAAFFWATQLHSACACKHKGGVGQGQEPVIGAAYIAVRRPLGTKNCRKRISCSLIAEPIWAPPGRGSLRTAQASRHSRRRRNRKLGQCSHRRLGHCLPGTFAQGALRNSARSDCARRPCGLVMCAHCTCWPLTSNRVNCEM